MLSQYVSLHLSRTQFHLRRNIIFVFRKNFKKENVNSLRVISGPIFLPKLQSNSSYNFYIWLYHLSGCQHSPPNMRWSKARLIKKKIDVQSSYHNESIRTQWTMTYCWIWNSTKIFCRMWIMCEQTY